MRFPPAIEHARRAELERALRLLRRGEDAARVLDGMSRRLANKLLHAPTKSLRRALALDEPV
jgi:glutamyl-tRNA reductase